MPENTLHGILTIIAGIMIHLGLGIVSTWGNIIIYVTSKLRATNEDLTVKFSLFIFPMTLAAGAVGMQLANKLAT
jgi:OFA family oxalate/formate antiporter-like MFS transporter